MTNGQDHHLRCLPAVEADGDGARLGELALDAPEPSEVGRGPRDAVVMGAVTEIAGAQVVQGVIASGGSMAEHAGDGDLLVMVRSGRGVFTTPDGAELPCGPGDAVLVRAGARHGFRQAGDAPVAFLGVQAT